MCVAQVDPSSGKITIYSLPDCMACKMTAQQLQKAGLDITIIDLQDAPEMLEAFKAQGIMQAPIVQTPDGDQWTGMRPDKIQQYKQKHAGPEQTPER